MTPSPRSRCSRGLISTLAASLAVALSAIGLWNVRVNLSPSAPLGLWMRAAGEPARGDWVMACLPGPVAEFGRLRGYHPDGAPFSRCPDGSLPVLKRVVALADDRVEVGPGGVRVDRRALPGTVPLPRDSQGRPLPSCPAGARRLAPGELWLLSAHIPNSWDSRYYGPVARRHVVSRMVPLVTY